jgi:uncharacterized protein DUF3558
MKLRRSVPAAPHAAAVPHPPAQPLRHAAAVPIFRQSALVAAVAGVAVVALSGCGLLSVGTSDTPAAAATPTATTQVTGSASDGSGSGGATSGFGSVKDSGDLPDPCTLLSRAEVTDLTGREVTQIDEDDADPSEATRYCQWQQDGGQLALFLNRTTDTDFRAQIADGRPVDGVGDDAFVQANHLYVLYGTVEIDVYSHGGSEQENLADATEVAKVVIPKI